MINHTVELTVQQENRMNRIEYLALFMKADTTDQKTEIIEAYLKAMNPDANFYLREYDNVRGCVYTITKRGESEGWDKPFGITSKVIEALHYAEEKHSGQLRDDGQPY